eukprot:gene10238-11933_t
MIRAPERLFSYYTSKISNEPSTSPFPITSYPEDRYRDVQLVNRITCQRVIPLCFAMWSSLDYKYETVRKLIEEEACDVNESDLEGFCPLHYAAIYGRIDACKLLLVHGADCSRKNNFGKTPADLAQDFKVTHSLGNLTLSIPRTRQSNSTGPLQSLDDNSFAIEGEWNSTNNNNINNDDVTTVSTNNNNQSVGAVGDGEVIV